VPLAAEEEEEDEEEEEEEDDDVDASNEKVSVEVATSNWRSRGIYRYPLNCRRTWTVIYRYTHM